MPDECLTLLRDALIPLAALVVSGECADTRSALSEEIKRAVLDSHDKILAYFARAAQAEPDQRLHIWQCIVCKMRVQTRQDLHINERPICVQCNAEMSPDEQLAHSECVPKEPLTFNEDDDVCTGCYNSINVCTCPPMIDETAEEVAATAYMIFGAINAPVRVLDYFSAIAHGGRPTNILPFSPDEFLQSSAGVVPVPERVENKAGKSSRPQERAIAAELRWTVAADRDFPNDWRVEAIEESSGDIFVAVFSGPEAEKRAREYATWPPESAVPKEQERAFMSARAWLIGGGGGFEDGEDGIRACRMSAEWAIELMDLYAQAALEHAGSKK